MKDSTAITTRLGDKEAIEVFRTHNTLIREKLTLHNGREIQHTLKGFDQPLRMYEVQWQD